MISLMSGIVFGLLLAFGARQTSKNPKNVWVVLGKSVYQQPKSATHLFSPSVDKRLDRNKKIYV